MRNFLLLSYILISFPSLAQDFYAIDKIQEIRLTFTQSNWDAQLDNLKATDEEAYLLAASVTVNGETFDSVGVKYKGNSSYRATNAKNPLHIELDFVRPGQSYKGIKDIKLGNGFSDPTFVREALSYEILRQYMEAPLANFAKLYINGEYYGLYSNQQSINKAFISNHFYTEGNNPFFKCNPQSIGGPGGSGGGLPDLVYGATDSASYYKRYELKSDYGWRQLLALMDTLKNKPASIDKILDIDRTLWMLAFNNLLINLDSYTGAFAQNYYLYQDDNGRFMPIVWDLNMSFGGFSNLSTGIGGGGLSVAQMQSLDPLAQATNAGRPLIKVLLSNPTWKRMYLAHLRTMANENFSDQTYRARALALQAVIDSAVLTDTKKFYTYAQFKSNIDQTVSGTGGPGGMTPPGITALMNARYTFLKSNANLSPAPPTIATPTFNPAKPAPGAQVWVSARVENAVSVWIGLRSTAAGVFQRIQMYDDGQHNDGTAGDKVYGASITAGPVRLQYYIYAENDQAGRFLPERAEYEFMDLPSELPLPAPGDVVINEFLADNGNGSEDEAGEKEDWVELYNRTPAPVSLKGLYLTDSRNKPAKWDLPQDAILPALGYLIVWLDEDSSQGPLHANFKLSKSGEFIMLSNGAGIVYDSLAFGAQTTDISFGRYPNGTGAFRSMPTTFAAANSLVSAVVDPATAKHLSVAPNPATQFVRITGTEPLGYLYLFDAGGRMLRRQILPNDTQTELDLNDIPPGVYWLRTAGSGGARLVILAQ